MHMDNNLVFIDGLWFVCLDELHIGPKTEDMVTFLSASPEFSKRELTSHVFKLCCLCLVQVVPEPPNVSLGLANGSGREIDLAEVIEPLRSSLLTSSAEQNIFLCSESTSLCVEMLADFRDEALQPSYDSWASVDFHGRVKICADLTKTYKDVRVAANVETDADVILSTGNRGKLLPQINHPEQRPLIDSRKTSKAIAAKACVSKLCSSHTGASENASSCDLCR